MKIHVRQIIDLFRTVVIHDKGIEDLSLPELVDIRNICKTVIEMANEQEQRYKEATHE